LIAGEIDVGNLVACAIGRHPEKGGGDEIIAPLGIEHRLLGIRLRGAGEFVAGELLGDEVGPRLIGVEGANDVVAITPGVCAQRIGLGETVRVRVAGGVQPVPGPAFAISGRCQQAIHHLLVSVRGGVGEEGV